MRIRSLFQTQPFKILLDAPESEPPEPEPLEPLGATENKSETNKNIIDNQKLISHTKTQFVTN